MRGLVSMLIASLACGVASSSEPGDQSAKYQTAMTVLDSPHPSVRLPVAALGNLATAKFVRVLIAEVSNASLVPLSFDVVYVDRRGGQVPLGMFSLYPANRPGTFIVSLRDAVAAEGAIEVSMRIHSSLTSVAPPHVVIQNIALIPAESGGPH